MKIRFWNVVWFTIGLFFGIGGIYPKFNIFLVLLGFFFCYLGVIAQ